jgi:CRISPR/Cas system CMR subunit Cmr4 (Cas7 group RAMP superfamily)
MPFGIKTIPGYFLTLSPIHHGGDQKTGSETLFRRQEYLVNGEYTGIPLIHGNAIRGVWRRLIMNDLSKFLDMSYDDDTKFKLKKDVYHSLFSGGQFKSVDDKDSGKIYIEFKRKIQKLIPPISLLGTSYGTQPLTGKLQTNMLLPICSELEDYLPTIKEQYKNRLNLSVFENMEFMFQTRKDDLREERKEGEQAVQMLIKYEVMKPGTVLYTELKLIDYNEIELSCLARIIELWSENPRIGGKSAVGLGKVKPEFELEATSEKYLNFLEENKQEIIEFLEDL